MTWEISDELFVVMLFFDMLGIAFSCFIACFIANYFVFGMTSKVDEEPTTSKIWRKARTRLTSVGLFDRQTSTKLDQIHPDLLKIRNTRTRKNSVKEERHPGDLKRLQSIESTVSMTSKSSLKKRLPESESSNVGVGVGVGVGAIGESASTESVRKLSDKRVSFGFDNPDGVDRRLEKRRRFYSDSRVESQVEHFTNFYKFVRSEPRIFFRLFSHH